MLHELQHKQSWARAILHIFGSKETIRNVGLVLAAIREGHVETKIQGDLVGKSKTLRWKRSMVVFEPIIDESVTVADQCVRRLLDKCEESLKKILKSCGSELRLSMGVVAYRVGLPLDLTVGRDVIRRLAEIGAELVIDIQDVADDSRRELGSEL